ncbi:S8 family serine peptidase [Rhodoferax sp.]|uniref:S8 family serine peptidase n=1 Tax=Rhodoferax sp. TaxID=50421 RepID=UPI0027579553|nr:S8 family serine peptidase [Rhodoferax sp.]
MTFGRFAGAADYFANPSNSGFATGPCGTWAGYSGIAAAISTIHNMGIPVVAATGNDSNKTGMRAPACLPRVIKVTAVNNDGVGTTISPAANAVNPANFPGEYIWAAPGYSVNSSLPPGYTSNGQPVPFTTLGGTSMAAPHVAGLYAAAKSYAVNNPQTWPTGNIVDNISVWLTSVTADASNNVSVDTCSVSPCPPSQTYQVKRIRLPALF